MEEDLRIEYRKYEKIDDDPSAKPPSSGTQPAVPILPEPRETEASLPEANATAPSSLPIPVSNIPNGGVDKEIEKLRQKLERSQRNYNAILRALQDLEQVFKKVADFFWYG